MSNFTAALKVEDHQVEGHITLCFCEANKGDKFSTSGAKGIATVINVEYWDWVDITVLTVDCKLAVERHEYYSSLGYTYDYEFLPHISMSKGDTTKELMHLKGEKLIVGSEYARLY